MAGTRIGKREDAWEYHAEIISSPTQAAMRLSELAPDGWELVTVVPDNGTQPTYAVFRRPASIRKDALPGS